MPDRPSLSRRHFLQGLALGPVLAPSILQAAQGRRVAVIGAGAFGAWTAYLLHQAGAEVTLVDAWGAGNSRSSSGGVTRVIRAIYGSDRIYTEMVQRAYGHWNQLERATGHHLYVETGALWMLRSDDDSYLRAALPICEELGFPVDAMTPEEAARRWPQIRFDGVRKVYLERRAGILSARRSCQILRTRFTEAGGSYRTARAMPGTIRGSRMNHVDLHDGSRLEADSFVFACGPWLGEVFPEVIGDAIRPTRQPVLYFGPPAGSDAYRSTRLPVWIDFGSRIYYGLPDVHHHGFKLADDTRGEPVDPTELQRRPTDTEMDRARAFLAERFPELADAPLIESRVCQYENSPDGDLIADRHPEAENVWLAGGGSGHGFKLSPTVGEMLAAAVLNGQSLPDKFSVARLSSVEQTETQFD